jgi:uncharacterized metal-binding protein YceD (DUF177 family)
VGKFDLYKVQLKSLSEGSHTFDYELDNEFFKKIDSPEVQKGNVSVQLLLKKISNTYELSFKLDGIVYIPCDRCLDEMEQSISYKGKLYVKFGADFSQEDDDVVIVPEAEGEINIAWFLYEFIVLSIPAKHVHMSGKCNKTMAGRLKKHLVVDEDENGFEADDEVDFVDDEVGRTKEYNR